VDLFRSRCRRHRICWPSERIGCSHDLDHHISKPSPDQIASKATSKPARSSVNAVEPSPASLLNLHQIHLIPSELFSSLIEAGSESAAGAGREHLLVWTANECRRDDHPARTHGDIELTEIWTPCVLNGPLFRTASNDRCSRRRKAITRKSRILLPAIVPERSLMVRRSTLPHL
jgi:hypothetical protein